MGPLSYVHGAGRGEKRSTQKSLGFGGGKGGRGFCTVWERGKGGAQW